MLCHGIDLTNVPKFEKMIKSTSYLNRCFTSGEQRQCAGIADRFAARFAVKEAVLKAIALGMVDGVSLKDVEVIFAENGAPNVKLSGVVAETAQELGVASWLVSFAYSGPQAVASVIGIGSPVT